MAKNKAIREIQEYVAKLITQEQDLYSDLVAKLRYQLDNNSSDDIFMRLSQIHNAKIKLLESIYDKIKEVL